MKKKDLVSSSKDVEKSDLNILQSKEITDADKLQDMITPDSETKVDETVIKKERKKRSPSSYKKKKDNEFLTLSMSLALISLTKTLGNMFGDKWGITDKKEAAELSQTIITYLDTRFPEWESNSPELLLIAGLSSYFTKRLIVSKINNE